MKTILTALSCFISVNVLSQNITNTLGTSGLFTIKDASNNYLTLSQSTGQLNLLRSLRLENTTSSGLGTIFKGVDRFLHNFGSNNTFLGIESGNFTMNGFGYNTAVGYQSLTSNITGGSNTALGSLSLSSNTTGPGNTAVGYVSMYSNTTGGNNTAVGPASLYSNTTGGNNTALGYYSLKSNTTGGNNTSVGYYSLESNTTGDSNTSVGFYSLRSNSIGNSNTALGNSSLRSNNTGTFNTAVGLLSLSLNTTGNLNTALGYSTGSTISSGTNLTCIGYNSEPTSGSAINQITLGNSSITSLRCNVQTITSLSDARDKKNISDLTHGLDFIMKVKPRLFNWDKREWYDNNISDGSKMKEAPTAGFIAQELDEVQTTENAEWLNLVLKDNPEKLEATSGNLLPVIVKAIQDLKTENDELKDENKEMEQRLLKLEQTQNKLMSELEKFKLKESKMTEVNEGDKK